MEFDDDYYTGNQDHAVVHSSVNIVVTTTNEEFARKLLYLAELCGVLDDVVIIRRHYRDGLSQYDLEPRTGKEVLEDWEDMKLPVVPL